MRLMYMIFVVIELAAAALFQQQERAEYMKYLLMNSFEVEK